MKKRILIITGNYFGQVTGGSEYQLYLLAKDLLERNFQIYYLFVDNGRVFNNELGIKLIPIKKRHKLRKLVGRYFIIEYFKVISKIKQVKPDIIYNRTGSAFSGIAAHYCKNNHCKMVWHIASSKDVDKFELRINRKLPFKFIDRKMAEYGIRNTDHIIGQAQYQNSLLYKNYGRKCDLIVPNFQPGPQGKIEKKLPIKIVWVSNFKELKQPELFIQLAMVLGYCSQVKFLMIGRKSNEHWQKRIDSTMAEAANLEYLGEKPIEDVNKVLCGAHVFVNTSKYEGFPNTFIQAWLRKVPVVSLNVDPDDVLKKEKIGFHSKNFNQMVKDTTKLIEDERLRNNMGERAQKYTSKNHSLANIQKIVDLIDR